MEEFNKPRTPDESEDKDDAKLSPPQKKTTRIPRSFFSPKEVAEDSSDSPKRERFPILGGLFEKDEKTTAKTPIEAENVVVPGSDETEPAVILPERSEDTVLKSEQPEEVRLHQTQEGDIWITPHAEVSGDEDNTEAVHPVVDAETVVDDTEKDDQDTASSEARTEETGESDSELSSDQIEAETDEEDDEEQLPAPPAPIIPPLPNLNRVHNTPPPPPVPPVIPPTPPVTPTIPSIPPLPQPFNNQPTPNSQPTVNPNQIQSLVDQAEYRGEKRGQARGIVTGLVVGWLFGRRGKKKLKEEVEQNEKDLKQQAKEIRQLDEQQRLDREKMLAMAKTSETVKPISTEPEKPADVLKRVFLASEIAKEHAPGVDQTRAHVRYELDDRGRLTIERDEEEKSKDAIKAMVEDAYQVPDDRRVEMSSWHRIEVDKKTGQIVENPSLEYGKEFKYEQQQEKMKQDNTRQIGAVPVGSVVGGGSGGGDDTNRPFASDPKSSSYSNSNSTKQAVKETVKEMLQKEPLTDLAKPFFVASGITFFILLVLYLLFAL